MKKKAKALAREKRRASAKAAAQKRREQGIVRVRVHKKTPGAAARKPRAGVAKKRSAHAKKRPHRSSTTCPPGSSDPGADGTETDDDGFEEMMKLCPELDDRNPKKKKPRRTSPTCGGGNVDVSEPGPDQEDEDEALEELRIIGGGNNEPEQDDSAGDDSTHDDPDRPPTPTPEPTPEPESDSPAGTTTPAEGDEVVPHADVGTGSADDVAPSAPEPPAKAPPTVMYRLPVHVKAYDAPDHVLIWSNSVVSLESRGIGKELGRICRLHQNTREESWALRCKVHGVKKCCESVRIHKDRRESFLQEVAEWFASTTIKEGAAAHSRRSPKYRKTGINAGGWGSWTQAP